MLIIGPALFAKGLYDMSVTTVKGEKILLKKYQGKTLVVVNIATRCGYTGQLDDLEKFYKAYKAKGVAVIGLPSNDFGGQTPEGDKEVAKFCRLKYGTTFPILKKAVVTGKDKHKLVRSLVDKTNKEEIRWNFEKFVIDKKGLVIRFPSSVKPNSSEFRKKIDALL